MATHPLTQQLALLSIPYRVCKTCRRKRPDAEFRHDSHIFRSCESCRAEVQKRRDKRKDLQRTFGMSLEDFERLFKAQNGVCAICCQKERIRDVRGNVRQIGVDHDHASGRVRGLLCNACNRGVGFFGDNPERLEAAAAYLRRYAK